jgi:ankyrin repeat protein
MADVSSGSSKDGARKKLNVSELHLACSEDGAPAVKTLLEQRPTTINRKGTRRLSRDVATTPDREDVGPLFPIHTACQRREDSRKIIELLLDKGHYSISHKTVNGDTALHVACTSGNLEAIDALLSNSDQSHIRECLLHYNRDGNSPLHLAAISGNHKITSSLLEHLLPVDFKQVIAKSNRLGETCLGLMIRAKAWHSVISVLKHSRSNPATLCHEFVLNFPECALIEKLQALEHKPINVFVLGDKKSGRSTLISTVQYAAQSTLSKFITALPFVGSRAANEPCKCCIIPVPVEYRKQDHKCPFVFHDVSGYRCYTQEAIFVCSGMPLEALYIMTIDVRKNVEESVAYWLCFLNHQLVAYRHCVDQSPIKTRKMKVKVVIALTFCDLVSSSKLQLVNRTDFSSLFNSNAADLDIASQFQWCGNFNLNARRHNSLGMPSLISVLHGHCCFNSHSVELEKSQSLLAETYILSGLLLKEYLHTEVTTFSDVMGLVQHSDNMLCKMLPKEDGKIERLCHNLQLLNPFKVLSFDKQNRKFSNWYIVLDYKYLLKSVEDALVDLAPCAKNGIVTRQQIKKAFSYPPDFIVNFLEHLKVCEYVSSEGLELMRRSIRSSKRSKHSNKGSCLELPSVPAIVVQKARMHRRTKSESDTLDDDSVAPGRQLSASAGLSALTFSNISSPSSMKPGHLVVNRPDRKQPSKTPSPTSSQHSSVRSTRSKTSSREVPHYFFPSLVPNSQPEKLWEEDSSEYIYGFSWSLVPHEGEKWFLSPKFITIILFRLLFSFAPSPPNPTSFVDRLCKLWNRGILWSDPQGARVCVAISDESKVTLSMQCLQKYEVSCLSIRNEIMTDIKQTLLEMHPKINPRELFTPFSGVGDFPVIDPMKSCPTFDKKEILRAIMEERSAVICTEGKHHKPIDSLLHFEPMCYLSPPLLRELFDEEKKHTQISDDFCMDLAMNLSTRWIYLANHFQDTVIRKYYIDSLMDDVNMKKAPHDTAMEMLMYLKELDYKEDDRVDTYSGLCRSLFEISIFSSDEVVLLS